MSQICKGLKETVRIDGRELLSMRKIKIKAGPELGTSLVLLGQTKVMAHVSCEIVRPSVISSTEGSITINTEFSPMAFPSSEGDKSSELEVNLSRMLEKTLRMARAVDTEGLCIIAGEKVWSIRVDIRVLDDDGNVLDCASIATMAALLHFKRPDVTVHGQDCIVHAPDDRAPLSLSIHHIPVCVTFSIFEKGEKHVLDPCKAEELVQEGNITLVLNPHRELCTMFMAGGTPLDVEKILLCSSIASSKAGEIAKLIRASI